MPIKWTEEDVIKKVQEAIQGTEQSPKDRIVQVAKERRGITQQPKLPRE